MWCMAFLVRYGKDRENTLFQRFSKIFYVLVRGKPNYCNRWRNWWYSTIFIMLLILKGKSWWKFLFITPTTIYHMIWYNIATVICFVLPNFYYHSIWYVVVYHTWLSFLSLESGKIYGRSTNDPAYQSTCLSAVSSTLTLVRLSIYSTSNEFIITSV